MDGSRIGRWASAVRRRAQSLGRWGSDRWSLWRVGLARAVRNARRTNRRLVIVLVTVALVATGGAVATAGTPLSWSGVVHWFHAQFGTRHANVAHPTPPKVAPATTADTATGELGLENFYQYSGQASGAGSVTMVNLHTGNAIFTYDAFANPSRGHSTSLQITYNSMDRADSSAGPGWSLSATALNRLGSPLAFHPAGQSWPAEVTLTDGDGTTHVFKLDKHGSKDRARWDYTHPAGLHLFLQKNTGTDPTRSWVMTGPDRTRYFFDAHGYQSATADRNGNELSFAYTARESHERATKFLQSITDPAGRTTLTVTYFAKGDTYTFIDDHGNPVTRAGLTNRHIVDRVKSITDVDGRQIAFLYTDDGLLARLIDGAGTALAKTYKFCYSRDEATPNTRLVAVTDPRGNSTRLSYFDEGTDPRLRGRARSITDRLGAATTFSYSDPDGPRGGAHRTTVTDALTHATRYVLDGRGRPTTVTDAKGQTTRLGWDADNNLVQRRQPNNALTTATYEPNTGYPLEMADAEANAHQTPPVKFSYLTALGGHVADLQTRTSPEGRTWTFGYDGRGNLTFATDPAGTASPAVGDFTTRYVYDGFGQLHSETDANGHATTYGSYDPTGGPTTVTDALNHTTSVAYDTRGHVVSLTDARGKTSTFGFDLFGRPLDSREPKNAAAGEYIITPAPVYDGNNNVTVSSAPNGAQTTATYDAADHLVAKFAPKDTPAGPDRKTSYGYDKVGNVISVTQPNGNLTTGDPNDFVTHYGYDAIYERTAVTDARGGVTSYVYDNVGNVITEVDPRKNATPDPADFTTKFSYDLNRRARTATDAAGHTATVDYDHDGLVVATTDEEGNKTLLGYDPRGLLVETKTPHALVDDAIVYRTTRYEYDQVGNRTKVVSPRGVDTTDDPDDFAQVTVYDELNRVKEQILPYDKDSATVNKPTDKVINTYDEVGNLTKVSLPPSGGATTDTPPVRVDTTRTYFDNGWLASSTDPFGVATSYDYDALGGQTQRTTTGADGGLSRTVTWSYYPDGKLAGKSDPGFPFGSLVMLADNSDRAPQFRTEGPVPWTRTSAGSGFINFDYATHAAGTGANTATWSATVPQAGAYEVFVRYPAVQGAATNATYTLFGQTKTVDQSQHAGEWVSLGTFQVAAASTNEVKLSDAANGTVVADAVKFVRDTSTVPDNEFHSFAYQYDANGNLTTLNDNSDITHVDTFAMTYTGLNQVATMDEKFQGGVFHTSTYGYDPNGNLTRRTHDSGVDTFEYDVRDQVSKVTNAQSPNDLEPKVTTYTYTPRGQVQQETFGLGNTIDSEYYADGLLRHVIQHGGANNQSIIAEHTLAYDLNGNPTSDQSRLMNADNNDQQFNQTTTYTYDPRDRVNVVDGAAREEYAYDANNNVLAQVLTGAATPDRQTIFNTYDRNRLIGSSTFSAGFRSQSNYFYDALGRVSTIDSDEDAAGQARYTYDGFDRKFEYDQDTKGQSTQKTEYFYDTLDRITRAQKFKHNPDGGDDPVAKVTYQYLGASQLVLNENRNDGEQVTTYQYGLSGQRLSQQTEAPNTGGADYYYTYNPHGDVEAITIPSGQTAATYGYTSYGVDITSRFTGVDKPDPNNPLKPPVNVYRFNARQFDPNSGTYDVGFRDYSPTASRFLTPDHFADARADLRLGPAPADVHVKIPSFWEWLNGIGKAIVDHARNDPWQFVGELAIGVAAATAVAAFCATGIGCAILAGVAAGAAAAGYGYGVDVAQGEHTWDTGEFGKQVLIGGVLGGVTAGIPVVGKLALSRILGQTTESVGSAALAAADVEGATESLETAAAKAKFFSVQSPAAVTRLLENGGEPWPTGFTHGSLRDIFGQGLYTFPTREQAEQYLAMLSKKGADALRIVTHHISLEDLARLRTADLTSMTDEAANEIYDLEANHGFEHIRRMTGNFGVEDFFRKDVFHLFQNSIE